MWIPLSVELLRSPSDTFTMEIIPPMRLARVLRRDVHSVDNWQLEGGQNQKPPFLLFTLGKVGQSLYS